MECCIDFESLTRRSLESLALHKSFSTNLMQHTGFAVAADYRICLPKGGGVTSVKTTLADWVPVGTNGAFAFFSLGLSQVKYIPNEVYDAGLVTSFRTSLSIRESCEFSLRTSLLDFTCICLQVP